MGENLILNMANNGYTVTAYNRTTAKVDNFINGRAQGKSIRGAHSIEEFVDSLTSPRKIMLMVKAGAAVDAVIEQLIPLLDKGDIIIDGGNTHFPDTNRRVEYLNEKGILFIGTGVSGGEEGALIGPSIMPGGSPEAWPHVKEIFQNISDWNKGDLDSYLIEISRDIMAFKDEDGSPLVENILDTAGQKGTGKWTAITALDLGVPLTLIGEAVFARILSAQKDERVKASTVLSGPTPEFTGDRGAFIEDLRQAVFASKIVSYAQGYVLMTEAAKEYNWNLNYGGIALMWRGGCIIRSAFLGDIKNAYDKSPELNNLLLDDYFKDKVETAQSGWRRVIAATMLNGIPAPTISAALCYFDGYRTARLPANLLQAQRDYFGAHTYERLDKPRGEFFHTNWTGRGGDTSSTTYDV
ncbi:UNVERIFIED_CONTAM: hypothetical protein GTU68_038184 [Idotea baltica]|nr:hypothetical protein [Idotea baltica]